MKTEFSHFRTKTTKTHLAGKFPFQIDFENRKKYLPNIIFVHFSRNTTRTHSFFTLEETLGDPKSVMLGHFSRNTIKTPARLPQNSSKSSNEWHFGPKIGPRRAPAGPPGQPGRLAWPGRPLPGRLVGCLGWPGRRSARPGAGASSNRAAPPLLSPQVGYLVYFIYFISSC